MSTSEKGPIGRFVSAAWAILVACVLLWLAVWVFQQIVWWVVGLVVLAVTIWLIVWLVRWRRDRWLR